jgi:hypothetical protein
MRKAAGKKKWVIPGIHIPLQSTGQEPEMVSCDSIAILNTGNDDADVKLTVFDSKLKETDGYTIKVKAQRVKKVRMNDLIDPLPLFLETDYGLLIESDHEVVVQFLRRNTALPTVSVMGTMAWGTDI